MFRWRSVISYGWPHTPTTERPSELEATQCLASFERQQSPQFCHRTTYGERQSGFGSKFTTTGALEHYNSSFKALKRGLAATKAHGERIACQVRLTKKMLFSLYLLSSSTALLFIRLATFCPTFCPPPNSLHYHHSLFSFVAACHPVWLKR